MTTGRDGKQRHSAEQNKDVTACLSMLRIGLLLLIDGKRPLPWCTPSVRSSAASGSAQGGQPKRRKVDARDGVGTGSGGGPGATATSGKRKRAAGAP